ncbi:FAD-binding oxidoreductase [Paraburkholderia sp. CNPSo 3274]|uniref:NAD(P)/FAD-dependent oxidoreductase n=1 Tax=Paraburkholderia sp. CNPSo 3274 TaxID=2940932 RepID=UPI0020B8FDC9|nr:FAD-binding oxidoreductase [Paraburkholderia sp. CNPSo 3274]MCP3713693.1 FAD-binding oxidoreductase [Paraburkholderia sp. CNPSo 3274]
MIDSADVIVIGSGGLGAATAFHMAKRDALRVALVERLEIGSQTSPRAAGMVSCLRKSDLMIDLIKLAADGIRQFSEDTGQPLDWVRSGSLKVARRPVDVEVIQDDILRGRRHGLDVEELSVDAAHRLNPFLQTTGVAAVMRIGDDMYFNPAQLAVGFARAAQANGAALLPNTAVTRVLIEDGEVAGVDTTRGRIRAPVVVDAAGAWTRQMAEASGIRVPLVTTAQQLFVTEPVPDARAGLPMVRIMDAAVYMRPCDGGFLWGVYEENPRFFDMNGFDANFDIKDLPLDAEILWHYARDVEAQLPILLKTGVREHRGGLPTMTADGQHIVGPAPAIRGFYFASGCNVAGLSIAPALGEMLAAWIVDGAAPIDLTPLSIERFGTGPWPDDELIRQAAWQYRHFYGAR